MKWKPTWQTAGDEDPLLIDGDPFNLGSDDNGGGGGGGGGGANDGGQQQQQQDDGKKPNAWAMMQEMQTALKTQGELLAGLTTKLTTKTDDGGQQQQQQRTTTTAGNDPDSAAGKAELKALLGRRLIEDPGQFALDLIQAAEARANAANVPIRQQQGLFQVEQFKRELQGDPTYELAKGEFDAMVQDEAKKGGFVNLTPEQINTGINFMYEAAIGRTAIKARGGANRTQTDTRRQQTRGGSFPSRGGGGFGGRGANGGGAIDLAHPQSEVERILIESAREYNQPEENIIEAIKALREDIG